MQTFNFKMRELPFIEQALIDKSIKYPDTYEP